MCKIRTIQEMALAAATKMRAAAEARGTVATKAATAAQALFNAVAKANPYVILAMAILAGAAALYKYIKNSNEAAAAEKKHQAELKKRKEQMENFSNTVGTSVGNAVAKYKLLQGAYKTLRTEHEKKNWIKENKSAFEQLGLAIKSVNDADRAFIKQSAQVINALKLRAEASALQEMYTEAYKKKIKNDLNPSQANNRIRKDYKAGQEVKRDSDLAKRAGLTEDDYQKKKNRDPAFSGYTKPTTSFINESGAKKINSLLDREANARRKKEEDEPLKKLFDDFIKKTQEANAATQEI